MYKFILTITFGLLFGSTLAQVEQIQYYKFRYQVTPSGRYIICDYARSSTDSNASDVVGIELFKVGQDFIEGHGEKINGELSEWISNDTLLVYDFTSKLMQPKDTFPIKTEFKELGDFVIKTVFYKSNSKGYDRYEFDSVSISNDSILIRTISDKKRHKFMRFPLGATTIRSESDSVALIEVSGKVTKSMNFIYKNPNGTYSTGLPEIGIMYYKFTPRKKILSKELHKRKVLWEE